MRRAPSLRLVGIAAIVGACTQTVRFPPNIWGDEVWTDTYSYYSYYDTGTVDTGTGGQPPAPSQISRVFGDCDPDTGFDYAALTDGWTGILGFTVYRDADGRLEDHAMSLVDVDPAGAWERWQVELSDGADVSAWTNGESSAFDCAELETLTFAILVYDDLLRTIDCVTWGSHPTELATELVARDPNLPVVDDCTPITIL